MNTVPKADEQSFPNAKKTRKVERKGEKKKNHPQSRYAGTTTVSGLCVCFSILKFFSNCFTWLRSHCGYDFTSRLLHSTVHHSISARR